MRYIILLLSLFFCAPAAEAAASQAIYANGTVDIAVPASQYVNVFGSAQVLQQVGGPGLPTRFAEVTGSPISNTEYAFGPFTSAATVRINNNGPGTVWYSVSALNVALPVVAPGPIRARDQMAPVTQTTTVTALSSDLMNGLVIYTNATGATVTYTLPTGTLLDTAAGLGINQGFEWSIINTSTTANTITLAAGTGHTIVGDAITQGQSQATGGNGSRWFTRKTAANTFITYRIN